MQKQRHHYIPECYLRRWRGPDNKVVQFRAIYNGEVKPLRVATKATGFVRGLYEVKNLKDNVNVYETALLSPVDNQAAQALSLIEEHRSDWTWQTRWHWTRFILSLLFRHPREVIALKTQLENFRECKFRDTFEKDYAGTRKPGQPETFADFLDQCPPGVAEEFGMKLFASFLDLEKTFKSIMDLQWYVLSAEENGRRFLTSDQPVMMTALSNADAKLVIPVGPTRLFLATKSRKTYLELENMPRDQLVQMTNKHIVEGALEYVYGADDAALRFVRRHFGKERRLSVIEELGNQRDRFIKL